MVPVTATAKAGYVYLVTCPNKVYSKIGRWSNSLHKLEARYATYYGAPSVQAVWVSDAKTVEKRLKDLIASENLQLFSHRRLELVKCTRKLRRLFEETVRDEGLSP